MCCPIRGALHRGRCHQIKYAGWVGAPVLCTTIKRKRGERKQTLPWAFLLRHMFAAPIALRRTNATSARDLDMAQVTAKLTIFCPDLVRKYAKKNVTFLATPDTGGSLGKNFWRRESSGRGRSNFFEGHEWARDKKLILFFTRFRPKAAKKNKCSCGAPGQYVEDQLVRQLILEHIRSGFGDKEPLSDTWLTPLVLTLDTKSLN